MQKLDKEQYYFFFSIAVFILVYLVMAINRPFISDEFHEAVAVDSLKNIIPYVHKLFYKNVLGYYIKLPSHYISDYWWNTLIISRVFLAFIFTGTITWLCLKVRNQYRLFSIASALLCFTFLTQNLTHATSYRVDMLTAMAGIFSFISIKKEKYFIAGLLAGLSFYISQKGVFYCFAGLTSILYIKRNLNLIKNYLLGIFIITMVYILFWGSLSNIKLVLYSIFIKDTVMATDLGYDIRYYWSKTFFSNIFFWVFTSFSFAYLFNKQKNDYEKLLFSYSGVILILSFLMGQPWPYFFIILTPFLMLNIADFFERQLQQKSIKVSVILVCFAVIYSLYKFTSLHHINNNYQKFNLSLMDQILSPTDTYIAGFDLHSNYQQPHDVFEWLHAPNRKKLATKSKKELRTLIRDLEKKPAKIMVSNYRTKQLGPFTNYLYHRYQHLWGNIYTYSITVKSQTKIIENPLPGNYLLVCKDMDAKITLEDKAINCGEQIFLDKDKYSLQSPIVARFNYYPAKIVKRLDKKYLSERSLNFTYDF